MDEKSTWSPTWRIMNKGYMVSRNFRQSHLLETVKFQETMIFFNFFQHDKILDTLQGKFQSRVQDKQTPLGNYLKLIEFETYYFKPNPPLFSGQQNMQWSRNMVHSPFTLCLGHVTNSRGTAFG